jgi:hypothetical protein
VVIDDPGNYRQDDQSLDVVNHMLGALVIEALFSAFLGGVRKDQAHP